MGTCLQKAYPVMPILGVGALWPQALGPRKQARLGCHLVVVKVPIDGEAVSPEPLGLARGPAPGPLDHTGCIALGPHQLRGLLILLQGLCSEKCMRGSGPGGVTVTELPRSSGLAVFRAWLPGAPW